MPRDAPERPVCPVNRAVTFEGSNVKASRSAYTFDHANALPSTDIVGIALEHTRYFRECQFVCFTMMMTGEIVKLRDSADSGILGVLKVKETRKPS